MWLRTPTHRRFLWWLLLVGGCGGATAGAAPDPTSDGQRTTGGAADGDAAPADDDLRAALLAYGRGDLDGARSALAPLLRRRPEDPAARALGARVAAALGRDEAALALLEGTRDPELRVLEARLLLRAERLVTLARRVAPFLEPGGEATDAGALPADAPERELLSAYLAVARAGATHDLYQSAGAPSELPYQDGVPLPVVEIVLDDGEPVPALVATSADLTVLHQGAARRLAHLPWPPSPPPGEPADAAEPGTSPENAPEPGASSDPTRPTDELRPGGPGSGDGAAAGGAAGARPVRGGLVSRLLLGEAELGRVPFVTRDLAPIAEQLGTPILAVLGLDVLLRLRATLDGPGRRLLVRPGDDPGPPPPPGGVRFATFSGSHLAVRARLGPTVGGYVLVDSAGLFPLALVPEAVQALGVTAEDLEPVPGAPSPTVRQVALPQVGLGDVLLEQVPAIVGLAPADLGRAVGAPLAGLVGELVLTRFAVRLDPDGRRLWIE
jgi:hypothetical protein